MRRLLILVFLTVIGYGLYQIIYINGQYENELKIWDQTRSYKPEITAKDTDDTAVPEDEQLNPPAVVNQAILDAQLINADIAGWLAVDGTSIDYPFVHTGDNDYYLRRDINGDYANAGTIFMDYRCQPDFTDFVSALYGHNMRNGTMFADLRRFGEAVFFEENMYGSLYLPYASYRLNIFAFLEVRGDDASIYMFDEMDGLAKRQYLLYIKDNAILYRDIAPGVDDRFLIMSTCVTNKKALRCVVIARVEMIL